METSLTDASVVNLKVRIVASCSVTVAFSSTTSLRSSVLGFSNADTRVSSSASCAGEIDAVLVEEIDLLTRPTRLVVEEDGIAALRVTFDDDVKLLLRLVRLPEDVAAFALALVRVAGPSMTIPVPRDPPRCAQ